MSDPTFIAPWQDTVTLARNLSVSMDTVANWAAQGILPPSRRRGGKLMWKWDEVDEWLTLGPPDKRTPVSLEERIRNASRAATTEPRH